MDRASEDGRPLALAGSCWVSLQLRCREGGCAVGIAGVALLSCSSRRRAEQADPCCPFNSVGELRKPCWGVTALAGPGRKASWGRAGGLAGELAGAFVHRPHCCVRRGWALQVITAADSLQELLAAPHSTNRH